MNSPAQTASPADAAWRSAAGWSVLIAAATCAFIITLLVLADRDQQRLAPLNSPEIARLKTDLADRPNDNQLKGDLRQRDQQLRRGFFDRMTLFKHGSWLLLAAGVSLVIATKSYAKLSAHPATLAQQRTDTWEENRAARWGVALSSLLIIGVMGAWAFVLTPTLPAVAVAAPPTPAASPEILAQNWVSFRGFTGDGIVRNTTAPESWDGPSGKNILWKTAIPLPGHSSPIIFADRIFLTGSDGSTQNLFCFATRDGQLLWRGSVPHSGGKIDSFEDTGFAANTPVTDGARVYAIFAGGDLAAFDFSGKRLWNKSLGAPDSHYGYASSLAQSDGRLIVQWDQGGDPQEGKSFLFGFDGATGRQLWKIPRPVQGAWTSPLAIADRIYTLSNPWIITYSATDGKEIWRAKLMDGDVACSPVVSGNMLYLANDRAVAAGIATDGSGDVTKTHVKWTNTEITLPDMASPLTDGKYLLTVHGGGEITCLDAATGKKLWSQQLDGSYKSSPILVGRRVYLTSVAGVTWQFELADQYKLLGSCPLGEEVSASPAIKDGRIYLRGKNNLYGIGGK